MKRPRAIAVARDALAALHDTGQAPQKLDTGQSYDGALEILNHDIHKWVTTADDSEEAIMSTLRKFNLTVGLRNEDGTPCVLYDGLKLSATLLFENGNVCTDLSQSLEPPLLGGEAILDGGEASFDNLRITVLTSLCRGNRFCIRVAAIGDDYLIKDAHTMPMRTITKLNRTPTGKKAGYQPDATKASTPESKAPMEWPLDLFADELSPADRDLCVYVTDGDDDLTLKELNARTKEELWAEVTTNGDLILELQKQQQMLFAQLRKLQAGGGIAGGTVTASATA